MESFDFEDVHLRGESQRGTRRGIRHTHIQPCSRKYFRRDSDGETIERAEAGGVLVTVTETTELVRARACEAERVQLKEALAEQALRESRESFSASTGD